MTEVTALVLAAGAGRRYGGPKALARSDDGIPWLTSVTAILSSAGLESIALLPTSHPEAVGLLSPGTRPQFVDTYAEGIGASLRAGLTALTATAAQAALVALVDQPTLPRAVIARILTPPTAATAYRIKESGLLSDELMRVSGTIQPRLLDSARGSAGAEAVLRRAVFDGLPGHPVLIGRAHWAALIESLSGDEGAGQYFRRHHGERIECSDLWDGADIDAPTTPAQITEILEPGSPDRHERVNDPGNLRDSGNQRAE